MRATTTTNTAPQATAAKRAAVVIDDPSADVSNQAGISLLQLLARAPQRADSDASTTDPTVPAASDKPATKSTSDGASNNDASALALAMLTQAVAGALGVTVPASQQPTTSNTGAAATDGSDTTVGDATQSSNGSSLAQDLASMFAQNVVADAKIKSDTDAQQLAADPTKGHPTEAATANTAAASANSLAHAGLAAHFALQHAQRDTNLSELKSPVGSAAWPDELGSQLTWMSQNGVESGSLRVAPEHLGPVEVRISVHDGAVSVWFGAAHPDTRAALEHALPRLREMFAGQGMTLTDSGVSRESPRNAARPQAPQSVAAVSAIGSSQDSAAAPAAMSIGLVDTYA